MDKSWKGWGGFAAGLAGLVLLSWFLGTGTPKADSPLRNPTDFTGISITGTDLDLTDTDAGAGAGPEVNLHRDSSTPAASDLLGQIDFEGEEATSSTLSLFARIGGVLVDATENSVDGALFFSTTAAGTGGENGLAEAMRITNAQDVIVGHNAILAGTVQEFQVSTVTSNGGINLFMNSTANNESGRILIIKGAAAGRGALTTAVVDNEELGDITWGGSDGTDFNLAAQIAVEVDGAPSDGTDMPGAMIFLTTPDGSGTPAERLRISSAGLITFAAGSRLVLDLTTEDQGFIDFNATADADATSAISTFNTSGATTDHIQILLNGVPAWIAVSTADPSA